MERKQHLLCRFWWLRCKLVDFRKADRIQHVKTDKIARKEGTKWPVETPSE